MTRSLRAMNMEEIQQYSHNTDHRSHKTDFQTSGLGMYLLQTYLSHYDRGHGHKPQDLDWRNFTVKFTVIGIGGNGPKFHYFRPLQPRLALICISSGPNQSGQRSRY